MKAQKNCHTCFNSDWNVPNTACMTCDPAFCNWSSKRQPRNDGITVDNQNMIWTIHDLDRAGCREILKNAGIDANEDSLGTMRFLIQYGYQRGFLSVADILQPGVSK